MARELLAEHAARLLRHLTGQQQALTMRQRMMCAAAGAVAACLALERHEGVELQTDGDVLHYFRIAAPHATVTVEIVHIGQWQYVVGDDDGRTTSCTSPQTAAQHAAQLLGYPRI